MQIIIHGSENSLDKDGYIVVDKPMTDKECKILYQRYPELNLNAIMICEYVGLVTWCHKGVIDEVNNSILKTFCLHKGNTSLIPISGRLERSYGLKMLRTIRGLLSYCSRTEIRPEIKKALVSDSMTFKIDVLKKIDLTKIDDFYKSTKIETYKFYAFQLGQTLALLEDDIELFTKNSVAKKYPELKLYLDRVETDAVELQIFLERFINFIDGYFTKIEKLPLYKVMFHGCIEIYDCKKEIEIIERFDYE